MNNKNTEKQEIKDLVLPQGFLASGIHCGIKRKRKDLGILFSEIPCDTAAVYTQNSIKGASISLTREHLIDGKAQAILINSGVANTGTGKKGIEDARVMAQQAAEALGIGENDVLVASTGIIGIPLPMDKIALGMPIVCAKKSPDGARDFAQAIRTTDTFDKTVVLRFNLGGKMVTMTGIAKGSGMIHPNMATMLAFILTDLNISAKMLQQALKDSTNETYNMITVDGETSTNDMVVIMANGQAGNDRISSDGEDYSTFLYALNELNIKLARLIARDGEGATKLLEIRIEGAQDETQARNAAKAVAKSSLVKTAVFGADANWGRILCALGYSDAVIDEDKLDIFLMSEKGRMMIVDQGEDNLSDYKHACSLLDCNEVTIVINLNMGDGTATAYGCDLSFDYVRINGAMRS